MTFASAPALALLLALLFPLAASAHPLGNFTVNRYSRIELEPERVTLRYVLDLAEIPALQELNAANVTGAPDGAQRAAMLRRFSALVREGARLSLGGAPVQLQERDATLELVPGEAGLSTMRISLTLKADVRIDDGSRLRYEDATLADRIGWREVVLRVGRGLRLGSSSVPSVDVTDELRRYPTDPLAPPLAVSSASATVWIAPGEGSDTTPARDEATPVGSGDGLLSRISALVRTPPDADPLAILLAIAAAAGLGAVHAVTPGHGKTVMAAYLVGTRGSARQALALGGTVAVSHTLGVLLLALFVLGASTVAPVERSYPYLSAISALIVVAIGFALLLGAVRTHAHDRAHAQGRGHHHPHDHGPAPSATAWRGLVALGLSGGIVPSASALLLLFAALSVGRPDLGLALIVAFGIGMAAVFVGIGLVLVRAGRAMTRHANDNALIHRASAALPLVTALIVLLVGVGLAVQAGQQLLART